MGKGDRRGKARSAKGLPELAPIQPHRAHPRDRRGTNRPEDARRTALTARCHHYGDALASADRDARLAASAVHMGEPMGWVIERLAPRDLPTLWPVWTGFCRAMRNYRTIVLGKPGSPANSALPMLPEPVEADPSLRVDTRTPAERHDDAVAAWMRWHGWLGCLPTASMIRLLHGAERGDGPDLWRDRRPTHYGRLALVALRLLADIVAQSQSVRRGRPT
jgi:hypothetical protein